jgi:uncharacterized protein
VAPTDAASLVRELSRRFQTGEVDAAMELYHPEIRVEQPASLPHGGWHHGLAGLGEMAASFARHWDRTIDEPHVLGCGDAAVQVTTQTWTAKETGKAATVDVVELFSVADDRIAEIRVFQQDTHALLQTLVPGEGTA